MRFRQLPGSSSEAIRQAAGNTRLPIRRGRLRQRCGRLAKDLKATRAAVAILKSNSTECRFSILDHILLLLVDPIQPAYATTISFITFIGGV